MKYVNLGESGVKVSQVAIGTWFLPRLQEKDELGIYKVDKETTLKILKRAYDEGVNFIDTANRYHGAMAPVDLPHVGNAERIVGEFLKTVDRESVVISTKVRGKMGDFVNGEGLSRKHILWQIKESLKRLGTSYIDVYFIHWPDPDTPKLETLRTLNSLVNNGLVYYLGVSNHSAVDVMEFLQLSERHNLEKFIVMQEKYNMLERDIEKDKAIIAKRFGLAIMAYSPLAQGFLTGKYVDKNGWKIEELSRASITEDLKKRYFTEANLRILLGLKDVASELGITLSQLAISWLLKRGEQLGITVIPLIGASKIEHLEDNLSALNINLRDDYMKRIEQIF
ncbi:aldo/keto reductase [Saccharolobus solfataricus]|nr:aldo/keto reductase [Saccharolobus solfataricus]AKA73165.1 aldo/keto reductase [Saccharolobus solfataricus]AKA75863.1 aldo/keto reductase [Saccharolobus solfataricus]AKA78555.1 aldo/keto reductase [Saccharolobus solfataricus]AZF83352.1 aldo/keto reductase [Saccharolobus solfataricus]QPG50151.1 aldo/keto reductase [Saccharolobus solfataricus]